MTPPNPCHAWLRRVGAFAALLAISACAPAPPLADGHHPGGAPRGATIEPSGFATILSAPPSTTPVVRPPRVEGDHERIARERGIPLAEAELLMNPNESARSAAMALDKRLKAGEAGNYVGIRVVRDPDPRFAFQFRRDAKATLARYTTDPRFAAVEGGATREELQPLFDEWQKRFEPHRIYGGGSVMEFDGEVHLNMTIDEAGYRAIAAREKWVLPERVRLNFQPAPNPRSVDSPLAPVVRVFAREDRSPSVVALAALRGRLVLRDGCFRMQDHGVDEPLVLFGRDVELVLDEEGYMAVRDARGSDFFSGLARVGEPVVWSGPRGVDEEDEGVRALRAACGADPVVAIGEPHSEREFDLLTGPPGR